MATELNREAQSESLVEYRLGVPEDSPFVFSSWLRSFRSARCNHLIPKDIYFANEKACIERTLVTNSLLFGVLANPEDQRHIIGYVIAEMDPQRIIVHWCYVKSTFRRMGFARVMLNVVTCLAAGRPIYCSHLSANDDFFRHITSKYQMTYNPGLRR